jgi:hypothetical protein
MKRKGTLVVLVALAMVLGGYLTFAAPHEHGEHGILHALGDILAELQVISGQLASGGSGGGGDDQVTGAAVADGLLVNPGAGSNVLVHIAGPGRFLSARVTKQGGATGLTAVVLKIDSQDVTHWNIEALKNWALTANNPHGIVVSTSPGGIDTVTIGFQEPLTFQTSLDLVADVNESDIVQLTASVIYGH